MPVRRELGVRTCFNILGPLTNPAKATHQLMGVFSKKLCEPLARVLGRLGVKHAVVVHGEDGLDEITTSQSTYICEFINGSLKKYMVAPEKYGIKKTTLEKLKVNTPEECRDIALEIINGKTADGPVYDLVVLNSAFALYAADAVKKVEDGLQVVKDILRTKKAAEKLELLKKISHEKYPE